MWVIAGAAVLSIAGAVVFVVQARNPEWSGCERLAPTDAGIDFQPKMLFMRDFFVYGDARMLGNVNEEETVELKIKHAGSTIRLCRWWFHDRAAFEVFARMVAARSGQEVKRDWLS